MRAATFAGVGLPLAITEVPDPEPGTRDAILRIDACGVCGSDLHATAIEGMVQRGAVLGHELSGTIVALGDDPIGDLRLGDRVTSLGNYTDGTCAECLAGRSEFCESLVGIGALLPGDLPGGYAELMRASTNDLVRVPSNVSSQSAALVEPLATALISLRLANLEVGDRVAVIGGGPVGLGIAMWCRFFGARSVVLSEPNAVRRVLGSRLGATASVDPSDVDDLGEAISESGGGLPDVVFEAVGRPGMLNAAIGTVRRGGTVIAAGVCMEHDTFDHLGAYAKQATVRVPAYYNRSDFEFILEMMATDRVDVELMITDEVSLDELPTAFERLRAPGGECKVLVRPSDHTG